MDSDSERDFEALVRKSGTVFTTNVGNGPEEMVLAIATPTLKKTQVATQADLVAAGYIRVDGLKRAEAERDRFREALTASEQQLATAHADMSAFKKATREEVDGLKARLQELEAARQGEQEGIAARNEGAPATENPYPAADESRQAARQAWNHGWKLRDILLNLNERVRVLGDEGRAASERNQTLEQHVQALLVDKAALQAHVQALQAEKQALGVQVGQLEAARAELEARMAGLSRQADQHEHAAQIVRQEVGRLEAEHTALLERYALQSNRLHKIQAAYQRLLLEAPHATNCGLHAGAGCDCWLLKYGYAALETR